MAHHDEPAFHHFPFPAAIQSNKVCLKFVDNSNMATQNKKKMILIRDCRDCQNFLWDFDLGQFMCALNRNKTIEEIHTIPNWCPLPHTKRKKRSKDRA